MESLIKQNRAEIVQAWIEAALNAFPADSAKFFSTKNDPFANPVGTTVTKGLNQLIDALIENRKASEIAPLLDPIVQVFCVQEFSPSKSVAFAFLLKNVLREKLAGELQNPRAQADFINFETRIDRMACLAFDVYVKYRMRIADIRVNEVKNQVATLYRKSTIFYGDSESDPNHDKEAPKKGADSSEVGSG